MQTIALSILFIIAFLFCFLVVLSKYYKDVLVQEDPDEKRDIGPVKVYKNPNADFIDMDFQDEQLKKIQKELRKHIETKL
jgi:hypothetical protein